VDQLALAYPPLPGIGHNQPPELGDPIDELNTRLATSHGDLVARFRDLDLACARVPNPIRSEEDAATVTDFIAECQTHIKKAEAAHRKEKELFLKAGRAVDAFFKRRCEKLSTALTPVVSLLKAYRDEIAETERQRQEEARSAAEAEARRAAAAAEEHRAVAELLAIDAQNFDERRAAEELRLAEEASERAEMMSRRASATPQPTHIRGDYGAIAYVTRSWTFEVVDLDRVPREYMSLDVEVVRDAITRDGVREIPGLRVFQSEALRVRGVA